MPQTPFDFFLVIVALVAAALGFRSGFLNQLGSLAGIIIGIIVCRVFGPEVEQCFAPMAREYNAALVTVLVYTILFLAVYFLAIGVAQLIRRIVHSASLGIFDRVAGAIYKAALWIFLLSLLLNLWVAIAPSHLPAGKWTTRVIDFAPEVIGSESAQQLWHDVKEIKLPSSNSE